MNKNIEYIQQLQEKNRLKKMMTEKSEAEQKQADLERGFSTHFRGAHATKVDATQRIVVKPVVKMNRVSPQGLAKRLLPSDIKETFTSHTFQPSFHSSSPRSTTTDGYRYINGQVDVPAQELFTDHEYEQDFENEEEIDVTEVHETGRDIVQESSEEKSNALLSNIDQLSKEQKMALLQLLQDSLENSISVPQPSSKYSTEDHNSSDNIHERNSGKPLFITDKPNVNINNYDSLNEQDNLTENDVPPSTTKTDTNRAVETEDTAEQSAMSRINILPNLVTLKLRCYSIHNPNASNLKYMSIHSLRMRYYLHSAYITNDELLNNHHIAAYDYIDLLQYFTLNLKLGIEAINSNSKEQKEMNNMLIGSARSVSTFGNASFRVHAPSLSKATELVFNYNEGESLWYRVKEYMARYSNYRSNADKLEIIPGNLKLLIWNGTGSNNSSAMKEVDITVTHSDNNPMPNSDNSNMASQNIYSAEIPDVNLSMDREVDRSIFVNRCRDNMNQTGIEGKESKADLIIDIFKGLNKENYNFMGDTTNISYTTNHDRSSRSEINPAEELETSSVNGIVNAAVIKSTAMREKELDCNDNSSAIGEFPAIEPEKGKLSYSFSSAVNISGRRSRGLLSDRDITAISSETNVYTAAASPSMKIVEKEDRNDHTSRHDHINTDSRDSDSRSTPMASTPSPVKTNRKVRDIVRGSGRGRRMRSVNNHTSNIPNSGSLASLGSLGSLLEEGATHDNTEGDKIAVLNNNMTKSSNNKGRRSRVLGEGVDKDEVELRRSIEYLSYAEHYIHENNTPTIISDKHTVTEIEGIETDNSGLAGRYIDKTNDKDYNSNENIVGSNSKDSSHSLVNSLESTINNNIIDTAHVTSSNERLVNTFPKDTNRGRKMGNRREKIERVNEQVHSVLSDLASILNSLPTNSTNTTTSDANNSSANNVEQRSIRKLSSYIGKETETDNALVSIAAPKRVIKGKELRIEVISTWGDRSFVGLNSIEIYDAEDKLILYPAALSSHLNNGNHNHNATIGMIISNSSDLISPITITKVTAWPNYTNKSSATTNINSGGSISLSTNSSVVNVLNLCNALTNDEAQWLCLQKGVVEKLQGEKPISKDENFNESTVASISISFSTPTSLSFMRVFNFNSSRSHNSRGVRQFSVYLDDSLIYEGELMKGSMGEIVFKPILRQAREAMLRRVEEFRRTIVGEIVELEDREGVEIRDGQDRAKQDERAIPRPSTALSPAQDDIVDCSIEQTPISAESSVGGVGEKSFLSSSIDKIMSDVKSLSLPTPPLTPILPPRSAPNSTPLILPSPSQSTKHLGNLGAGEAGVAEGVVFNAVHCFLLDNYGDSEYIGIENIVLLDSKYNAITTAVLHIHDYDGGIYLNNSSPPYLFPFVPSSRLTRDKSMTICDKQSLDECQRVYPSLSFILPIPTLINAIEVRNYVSDKKESLLRGVRSLLICCELNKGKDYKSILLPVRIGIEYSYLNTMQLISLSYHRNNYTYRSAGRKIYVSPIVKQTYEHSGPIYCMSLTVKLLDNHGDPYYVGLDNIDIILADHTHITQANLMRDYYGSILAYPHSINILHTRNFDGNIAIKSTGKDVRCVEELLKTSGFGYLAPLAHRLTEQEIQQAISYYPHNSRSMNSLPNDSNNHSSIIQSNPKQNIIRIDFSLPISISAIRFVNYSRTIARGTKTVLVEADQQIIYMGDLIPANEEKKEQRGQTMIFSRDINILNQYKDTVIYCGHSEQDVLCINERQVMARSKRMYENNINSEVDINKRPATSFLI